MKTVAFFDNKGGGGRSTLVYHLAYMLAELGTQTLLVDLDPLSHLTAMCLPEEELGRLWPDAPNHPLTVLGGVQPLLHGVGDLGVAHVAELTEGLGLIAGDPGLFEIEGEMSEAWSRALARDERAFRMLSAFHRIIAGAAHERGASVVLVDVGPNLGAINRMAILGADALVTPLTPDMFSIQGLRSLGRSIGHWREGWQDRLGHQPEPRLGLPSGVIEPIGYVVMQSGTRLRHPAKAYQRWLERLPAEFHRAVLRHDERPVSLDDDPYFLGIMRDFHSLVLLAQDVQKPMFQLKPADGAIGPYMDAVRRCREDFKDLASQVMTRAKRSS